MEALSWENLREMTPGAFRDHPHYDRDADSLTLFVADDESYRERIDSLLSVYRSFETKEVVGCHIKHVHRILETVHAFRLSVHSNTVQIGLLLLGIPLATEGKDPVVAGMTYREILRPIAERVGEQEIDFAGEACT